LLQSWQHGSLLHAQNADLDVEANVAAAATVRSFVDSWNRAYGSAYGELPGSHSALGLMLQDDRLISQTIGTKAGRRYQQ
jgi:hypothetical protein